MFAYIYPRVHLDIYITRTTLVAALNPPSIRTKQIIAIRNSTSIKSTLFWQCNLFLDIVDFIIFLLYPQLVGGFGIDGATIGGLDIIANECPVVVFNQIRQQALLFVSQGFVLRDHIGATEGFFLHNGGQKGTDYLPPVMVAKHKGQPQIFNVVHTRVCGHIPQFGSGEKYRGVNDGPASSAVVELVVKGVPLLPVIGGGKGGAPPRLVGSWLAQVVDGLDPLGGKLLVIIYHDDIVGDVVDEQIGLEVMKPLKSVQFVFKMFQRDGNGWFCVVELVDNGGDGVRFFRIVVEQMEVDARSNSLGVLVM